MDKVLKEYEEFLKASDKKVKGIKYSLQLLNRYIEEYDLNMFYINHKEAQEFQNWLMAQGERFSPASVQGVIGPLTSFYDYLSRRQLVCVNPFSLIDRIKTPFKIPKNIPSEKDLDKLLLYLSCFTRGRDLQEYKKNYKAHVLCELLYSTGIRISEASSIRLEDVNLLDGTILIRDSKTKTERTIFLNDYIKSILHIYISELRSKVIFLHNGANPDLLFGSSVNLKHWLNRILTKACRDIGIDKITTHIFRHAFGYHMLKAGCDIRKIQSFLGHKRLNTTQIYTKVDTEALRNVLDQHHPRQVKKL